MTFDEIKQKVENGEKIYWKHEGYQVIKGKAGFFVVMSDEKLPLHAERQSKRVEINSKRNRVFFIVFFSFVQKCVIVCRGEFFWCEEQRTKS